MNALQTLEFHMLNYFKNKGEHGTTVEMNKDLQKNGIPPAGKEFSELLLDTGFLDRIILPNQWSEYKINEYGIARWNRLYAQLEREGQTGSIQVHGDIIGSIVGSQSLEHARISPKIAITNNAPNTKATKRSVLEILSWVGGILGIIFLIWEFILKRFLHQP